MTNTAIFLNTRIITPCFVFCLSLAALADSFGQETWRPFSDDSPWNQKIPAGAETDLQSKKLIDDLAKGGLFINIEDWSIPVYFINADTMPKVNVINSRPGIFGRGFAEPNQIPIQSDFIASPPVGDFSDNHLCIVDTSKGLEWDLWAARKNKDGAWTTGLGAVTDLKSDGVEKPWFEQANEFDAHRSRAGGFPLIAGLIRPDEIKAGKIDHALVFAYQRGRSEFLIPPASTAQATIMEMNNRFGIPMGGRIQLDPDIDVDTLNLTPACKIIAKALQEYGAFNGDYAGATVLYADNSPLGLEEWKGVLGKEDLLRVFTPDFIRNHFRVIDMGNPLPGQNLKDGRLGSISFDFPGSVRVSIDWIKRRVDCKAADSVNLASVTPVFRTADGNALVFVNGKRQTGGRSAVNFTQEVVYAIHVPNIGKSHWTVTIKKDDSAFWQEDASPEAIGKLMTDELLSRPDFMMYKSEQVSALHYAEACAGFGAARLAGLLDDQDRLSKLVARYQKVLADSIPNTANHVDANVYGILPLELFLQTKDTVLLKQGIELADVQWDNPLPDGLTNQTRFWIDDVWMIGALQVQAYRVTGKPVYLDRAALEIDAYLKKLQQPNGLFHHGENAPFFWGRGNGWVAAGLAELLSELPKTNPHHASILDGYVKMMNALLRYQAEDGMWRQLIDHEESWKETSSTAMFGYAMCLGVKKGLLPESPFTEAYRKAWLALTDYVEPDGKIREVCVGTGKGQDVPYYLARPRTTGDFHGQAPMLWFAWSLLLP